MSNRWTPHKGKEPRSPWLSRFLFRQAGFLDSEPFQKGFLHAPVCGWRLAAVLLSSSPGGALRVRRRESKGEAFVTRQRYEHPLAGAAGLPAPCAHSHRTQRRRQANGRTRGTGAGREPPRGERPHVPRARHASEVGDAVPRQGCARPATGRSPQGMSATARTCSSPMAAQPPGRPHRHRPGSDPPMSRTRCVAAGPDPAPRAPARRNDGTKARRPSPGQHGPATLTRWTHTQRIDAAPPSSTCACGTKGPSPSRRPLRRWLRTSRHELALPQSAIPGRSPVEQRRPLPFVANVQKPRRRSILATRVSCPRSAVTSQTAPQTRSEPSASLAGHVGLGSTNRNQGMSAKTWSERASGAWL